MTTDCLTPWCRLSSTWQHLPASLQNLSIFAVALLITAVLAGLGHALGLGETHWVWHIPG